VGDAARGQGFSRQALKDADGAILRTLLNLFWCCGKYGVISFRLALLMPLEADSVRKKLPFAMARPCRCAASLRLAEYRPQKT
jgi:hypothetical protein